MPGPPIPTFCSEECKRGRLNKQKFDEQARELDCEKEYKNALRGIQRMKRNAADPEKIAAAEQAMNEFCEGAVQRKRPGIWRSAICIEMVKQFGRVIDYDG